MVSQAGRARSLSLVGRRGTPGAMFPQGGVWLLVSAGFCSLPLLSGVQPFPGPIPGALIMPTCHRHKADHASGFPEGSEGRQDGSRTKDRRLPEAGPWAPRRKAHPTCGGGLSLACFSLESWAVPHRLLSLHPPVFKNPVNSCCLTVSLSTHSPRSSQ